MIVRRLIAITNLVSKFRTTMNLRDNDIIEHDSHPDDDDQHMSESESESSDDTPQQKQLPKKKNARTHQTAKQ